MSDKSTKPGRRANRAASASAGESPAKRARATRTAADDILPEYDFSHARPNEYAARYAAGSNVVVLDPDVAAVFPTAASVNEALRALAGVIQKHDDRSGSGSRRRSG